jgi:hypothetical protein
MQELPARTSRIARNAKATGFFIFILLNLGNANSMPGKL